MVTKYCKSCDSDKNIDDFHYHPSGKYSRREICKKCRNAAERKRKEDPLARERALFVSREWYRRFSDDFDFKVKAATRQREYLSDPDNRERRNAWKRKYRKTEQQKEKRRESRKKNPKRYVCGCFGRAIYRTIGSNKKWRKWQDIVGYSPEDLMAHLESKFSDGMTWENYGDWHIDHIIPVAAFNFECEHDIDFTRCWSLNNLQPLWAKENMSKGDKIEKPFQPSLAIGII